MIIFAIWTDRVTWSEFEIIIGNQFILTPNEVKFADFIANHRSGLGRIYVISDILDDV